MIFLIDVGEIVELEKTSLDRGRTDCISLTNDLDLSPVTLTFNPLRAVVMTYSHANVSRFRR